MKAEASRILSARTLEMRDYARFLMELEASPPLSGGSTVLSTAKASFAIQNYSLAEAVVISLLNELSKTIECEQHQFAELTTEIQEFWTTERARMMRRSNDSTVSEAMRFAILAGLSNSGLSAIPELELRKAFLGNVDARAIRHLLERLALPVKYRGAARGGDKLKRMKDARNNLAHGTYSFVEVGRNYTALELREVSIRIRCYLWDLVRAFEAFISGSMYLSPGQKFSICETNRVDVEL